MLPTMQLFHYTIDTDIIVEHYIMQLQYRQHHKCTWHASNHHSADSLLQKFFFLMKYE